MNNIVLTAYKRKPVMSIGIIFLVLFSLMISLAVAVYGKEDAIAGKKKMYISTIKSRGIKETISRKVKDGIRLRIFESYGNKYHVLDDDAIKVMYKQAEAIMVSGCDDMSCMTQIAEGINADEIIYGEIIQDGAKLSISMNCLERKGISLSTKSIAQLSIFESRIDYAASEIAKKLMDPRYQMDLSKEPSEKHDLNLGVIEIKPVNGLDISIIQFKTNDENAGKIIEYAKIFVQEGDENYNKKKYDKARNKYNEILDRVDKSLREDSKNKISSYLDGIYKRIDSTYVMEFKPEIEKVDEGFKKIKNPNESDLMNGLQKYLSLEDNISKIPNRYSNANKQLKSALNDRKDNIQIALLGGYENKGDNLYRDYKFSESLECYQTAKVKASSIINIEKNKTTIEKIEKKLDTVLKTGKSYLANRVKTLIDQAEYYTLKGENSDAKKSMNEAKKLLSGSLSKFKTTESIQIFNDYAIKINFETISQFEEEKSDSSKYTKRYDEEESLKSGKIKVSLTSISLEKYGPMKGSKIFKAGETVFVNLGLKGLQSNNQGQVVVQADISVPQLSLDHKNLIDGSTGAEEVVPMYFQIPIGSVQKGGTCFVRITIRDMVAKTSVEYNTTFNLATK